MPQAPVLFVTGFQKQNNVARINDEIRAAASRTGAALLETSDMDIDTSDGVHPTEAGYRIWTPALVAAISTAVSRDAARRLNAEPISDPAPCAAG